VLIRPEQITLLRPAETAATSVTGKVSETRYHGHDALIAVDVAEAGLLQVRELGTEPPGPGDEVSLTVSGPVSAWPGLPQGTV
jgi:iron(III) transport system ATP-binding protein